MPCNRTAHTSKAILSMFALLHVSSASCLELSVIWPKGTYYIA